MATIDVGQNGAGTAVQAEASVSAVVTGGAPPPIVKQQRMSGRLRAAIAVGIALVGVLLFAQLLAIWPAVMAASTRGARPDSSILFGLWTTSFNKDVVVLLMVVMVGALSALMGVSRRFLYYAHRDELTTRDAWSYLLRPFQGALLALLVYFALRGGFLGQDAAAPINPYGVAATAGLVGLFTRHAVSRLGEIFDAALGKPREDSDELLVEDGRRDGGPPADSDEVVEQEESVEAVEATTASSRTTTRRRPRPA